MACTRPGHRVREEEGNKGGVLKKEMDIKPQARYKNKKKVTRKVEIKKKEDRERVMMPRREEEAENAGIGEGGVGAWAGSRSEEDEESWSLV